MKDTIIFNLKREWYDKIVSGQKAVEYRNQSTHWIARLTDGGGRFRGFKYAEFRLGYTKRGAIRRAITNIDIGPCPYDGWHGNYFRIHFKNKKER